jgi:uncharacterized OsmC-like protein
MTTLQNFAATLQHMQALLQRHPEAGLHDDAPATARWQSGLRCVASHGNGTQIATDMPAELGGSGEQVTPGWLFRAGLASCAATSIALAAAAAGITLAALEVRAASRSDTRGLLGMAGADGTAVYGGPGEMQLVVTISAPGVSQERLRALAEDGVRRSPIPNAVQQATPLALHINVDLDVDVGVGVDVSAA